MLSEQISGQYRDMERAITGRGEFCLVDKSFYCTPERWALKTSNEKAKILSRVMHGTERTNRCKSKDHKLEVLTPTKFGKKPGQQKRSRAERSNTLKRRRLD